jgi:hypothetical protein
MRTAWLVTLGALTGCAAGGTLIGPDSEDDAGVGGEGPGMAMEDPGTPGGPAMPDGSAVPDVRCAALPDAGPTREFLHTASKVISRLGDPQHRGFDLVASADSLKQTLEGWISYSIVDKALDEEEVDVFACDAGAWRWVGTALTDDEGYFALVLAGTDRLAVGMRDLFVSVAGDRTGARFLAYVAPAGTRLIVSDVDGTLTSSENAFFETIVLGNEPDERAGAPRAYREATAKGYQLIYVTARGNRFTQPTRDWLERKGFPRGPVRLAPSFVTLPGGNTSDYKTRTFDALTASGLALAAGVGNRASDVTAYARAGLTAERIFIEMPEYADEVQPRLDANEATGFATYDELLAGHLAALP